MKKVCMMLNFLSVRRTVVRLLITVLYIGKGAVYGYDAVGSFKRDDYGCMGSGQNYIMPILDNLVRFPGNLSIIALFVLPLTYVLPCRLAIRIVWMRRSLYPPRRWLLSSKTCLSLPQSATSTLATAWRSKCCGSLASLRKFSHLKPIKHCRIYYSTGRMLKLVSYGIQYDICENLHCKPNKYSCK